MSNNQNQVTTYIGIAFYTTEGFPAQSVIVLSNMIHFQTIASYGTVIDSVNGWVESWKHPGTSPTRFEPHLNLIGILAIGQVNKSPNYVSSSISSMGWKVQDARVNPDSLKHPYSNDFVRRALLHLCSKKTISLPSSIKNSLDGSITDGLVKLRGNQESRPDLFTVLSLLGDRAPVYGYIV
jgi:hypothetical protein